MKRYLITYKDNNKDNRLEFCYGENEKEAVLDLESFLIKFNNSPKSILSIRKYSSAHNKNLRLNNLELSYENYII